MRAVMKDQPSDRLQERRIALGWIVTCSVEFLIDDMFSPSAKAILKAMRIPFDVL